MIKGIIFDLDGTLLNTIDDIADSVNAVLKKHGLPTHTVEEYKTFVGSGAKVLITARDPHALADAVKKGYSICLLRDYDCIAHDADILINTVPAEIIDKNILSRLRKDVLLIDIASPPFGVDIGLAGSYGINAVRALGLPGKYAPEEAGRLIFKKAQPLL